MKIDLEASRTSLTPVFEGMGHTLVPTRDQRGSQGFATHARPAHFGEGSQQSDLVPGQHFQDHGVSLLKNFELRSLIFELSKHRILAPRKRKSP